MVSNSFQETCVIRVVLGFRNIVSRANSDEVYTGERKVILRLHNFHFIGLGDGLSLADTSRKFWWLGFIWMGHMQLLIRDRFRRR